MLKRFVPTPTRDIDFGARLQVFFVSAVVMVLVIRTQLWLTNYPQLGGGGLHIAHLLYGGFFMAIAIGILLVYTNRAVKAPAAVLGGIGFGFFIDELGKFITEDNDYFYKPAAALIYLIFVAFFLIIRNLERRRNLSPEEAVASAISLMSAAGTGDLHERDRRRALELLAHADEGTPLVQTARTMLDEVTAQPNPQPNRLERLVGSVRDRYLTLIQQRRFNRMICWVIGAWGIFTILGSAAIALSLIVPSIDVDGREESGFAAWASLGTSTVSALFVLAGIRRLLSGSREAAYRYFERALLIAIFLTSTFQFVESQFGAVFGLGVNLLLLFTLNRMADAERTRGTRAIARPAAATA